MKKTIIVFFCAMFLMTLKMESQIKMALIDLNKNYEAGSSPENYYQLFELPLTANQNQIEEFKSNCLKYKHVLGIEVVKNENTYLVKLLLDKKTENISGYFRDYLLHVSINKLKLDDKIINTMDYYTYLSQKLTHSEVSK